MFDVTTARQVDYTDSFGIQLQVTVFQDRENKGLWYLVPVPRLCIDNGQPAFNLTKYIDNQGGIAGICTFEVELFAPEEAKKAAQAQIPEITSWGQFIWTSGDVFFDFDLPVGDKTEGQQICVSPSLFGSNVARFQIELETEAALNSFVGAFTGTGALSPFSVSYSMGVLTQLLGARAEVKYTASVAIDYERTYESKKDTWGKSQQILVEVKQNLKSSGAGDVKVTPGVGGSPELVQMVRDWAWSVLETQVASAIETAQRQATGNENPISVVSDIFLTYSEDTIIEWSTPVSRFLPRFSAESWEKLYHEVDNRELVVIFELAGDPSNDAGVVVFEDVEVEVRYPTRTTDNSFKLSLGEGGTSSVSYRAPGGGEFDPEYAYRYTVNFVGGAPPYTSEWITDAATRVTFRPNRLGIRNVSFIGSGIPFDDGSQYAVKTLFIDFFETPPEGQEPKLQTKEMTENDTEIIFSSTYNVPIANDYNYRLRYQLTSGDVITVQPDVQFGSDNADTVFVLTPQKYLTSFSFRALAMKGGTGFMELDINGAYYDNQNPSEGVPPNYNWDGWVPEHQPGLSTSPTWVFQSQPDPQTAFFDLNGQVIYGDGNIATLANVKVPYSRRALILKDTEEVYSVEIFTDQIDWSVVKQVSLNILQFANETGAVLADLHTDAQQSFTLMRSVHGEQPTSRAGARLLPLQAVNLIAYNMIQPAENMIVKSLPLYYTLYRLRSAQNIVFYYNADYVLKDGTRKGTGQLEVTNKLQIHLPPVASDPPGVLQAARIAAR
ncbi:hypothetical protein [Rhodobacter lacus]|uniref:Uncharacterized protein n=1 Tax=Rhodobacter lacus TaxID=1641972 RepID=A0ABW5A8V0_9RHOB